MACTTAARCQDPYVSARFVPTTHSSARIQPRSSSFVITKPPGCGEDSDCPNVPGLGTATEQENQEGESRGNRHDEENLDRRYRISQHAETSRESPGVGKHGFPPLLRSGEDRDGNHDKDDTRRANQEERRLQQARSHYHNPADGPCNRPDHDGDDIVADLRSIRRNPRARSHAETSIPPYRHIPCAHEEGDNSSHASTHTTEACCARIRADDAFAEIERAFARPVLRVE